MAGGATAWQKEFTANPRGRGRRGRDIAALLSAIGRERVSHPAAEDGAPLTRLEILARVLWTRAAVDGDMTAIKLLLELLTEKQAAVGTVELRLEDFAEAELRAMAHGAALRRADEGEDAA